VSGKRPSDARLYPLLFLMLLIWSANYVIGKVALLEFPALLLAGLRTTISGAFLLPFYIWSHGTKQRKWTWSELRGLLMLGLFGIVLNQVLFVAGLAWTSVAHAAIIVTLMPILVLLFASYLGQERVTPRKVIGMLIAVAGVTVLQLSKPPGSGATLRGDLCIFLCVLVFAVFTVLSKPLTKVYGSLAINSIAYSSGALVLAPMTLWLGWHFDFKRASAAAWWSLLYMALFGSVLAYLIYNYALVYIPASRVSAFSYMQPLGATLLAVPLLGELISTTLVIGGILVLTGVYITERA
jgi:drug/metabolite transporter (DMT)-like permease